MYYDGGSVLGATAKDLVYYLGSRLALASCCTPSFMHTEMTYFTIMHICCIFLLFWRGRRWIFLDLARSLRPHHDVANQYKHFVVFKWLAHSFNPKVNITDLGVRNIVDVYLALFYCFFPEQLRLLTLQNLLDS